MCGRFAFYSPAEATAKLFGAEAGFDVRPRYNIAPTQFIAAVRQGEDTAAELSEFRWGLVPFWAKDPSIGNRMINARAETVAEKPSFRNAYRKRRCLILADGFYEWHTEGGVKVPYYISQADGAPFAFAGLWEHWQSKETDESLETATIVTAAANEFVARVHKRMPVIIRPEHGRQWLSGDAHTLEHAISSMPALRAWPVDRRVNNARNEDSSLIEAAGDEIT